MSKEPTELEMNWIIRWKDGPHYFGYKRSVLNAKIKSGEIPEPMQLSDNGRASGWLFSTILEWQRERAAQDEAEE